MEGDRGREGKGDRVPRGFQGASPRPLFWKRGRPARPRAPHSCSAACFFAQGALLLFSRNVPRALPLRLYCTISLRGPPTLPHGGPCITSRRPLHYVMAAPYITSLLGPCIMSRLGPCITSRLGPGVVCRRPALPSRDIRSDDSKRNDDFRGRNRQARGRAARRSGLAKPPEARPACQRGALSARR